MLCGNNIGPSAEGRLLEFFKKLRGRELLLTHQGGECISAVTILSGCCYILTKPQQQQ